jgi:hypothetical protein
MGRLQISKTVRSVFLFSIPIFYLALPGCGQKEPPTGEVSGTVTFKGQPLPEGMITFVNAEEGRSGSGAVKDGTYTCPNAPVGLCGIEVVVNIPRVASASAPNMEKRMRAKLQRARERGAEVPDPESFEIPKPEKSNAIPIPRKYANSKTSGLSLTVVEGQQTHDIELKP